MYNDIVCYIFMMPYFLFRPMFCVIYIVYTTPNKYLAKNPIVLSRPEIVEAQLLDIYICVCVYVILISL
jgi:hypothetical protein